MDIQKALQVMEFVNANNLNRESIEKKFRILSLKYHPDKNTSDSNAKEKFQELSNAKDFLIESLENNNLNNITETYNPDISESWVGTIFKEEGSIAKLVTKLNELNVKLETHPEEIINLKQILNNYIEVTGNQFDSMSEPITIKMREFRKELKSTIDKVTDGEDLFLIAKIMTHRQYFVLANREESYPGWQEVIELYERSAQTAYPLAVLELIDIMIAGWFYEPTLETVIWAKTTFNELETFLQSISENDEKLLKKLNEIKNQFMIDSKSPAELLSQAQSIREDIKNNLGRLHVRPIEISKFNIEFNFPQSGLKHK